MTTNNTISVIIPRGHLSDTVKILKDSKVKHWPFNKIANGWYLVVVADHPVASYLELKYGNRSS